MPLHSSSETDTALADLQREMEHIKDALRMLGLRPCSSCKRFFRLSDPAALFDCGEAFKSAHKGEPETKAPFSAICYRCIPDWWRQYRPEFSTDERQQIEHKLVHWLVQNHGARVIKDSRKLNAGDGKVSVVASCSQCHGTGKYDAGRCPRCEGGNIWVLMKPAAS